MLLFLVMHDIVPLGNNNSHSVVVGETSNAMHSIKNPSTRIDNKKYENK